MNDKCQFGWRLNIVFVFGNFYCGVWRTANVGLIILLLQFTANQHGVSVAHLKWNFDIPRKLSQNYLH